MHLHPSHLKGLKNNKHTMLSRNLITPIIMLVTSAALFWTVIDPHYQDIKTVNAEIAQYDDALNKSKELQRIRDSLLEKYNLFSPDDLKRLDLLLPDTVDNIRLILDIDTIAARYGAVIRDLSLSAPTGPSIQSSSGDEIRSVDLKFSISADYDTFLKFIRDLQDSLRIVDIVNLSFKAGSTESIRGPLYTQYAVTIRTYWLP